MKGVYIFLADGFEDMEALGTRDILLRGGVDVKTVSITEDLQVCSSHGLKVTADLSRSDFFGSLNRVKTGKSDMMIFPGGMPGSKHLAEDKELMELMKRHYVLGGSVAAICAAPGLVASQLSPLFGLSFTCYEGFQQPLLEKGAIYRPQESAVVSGRLITGRGAGHAVPFGLSLVRFLKGAEAATRVQEGLML